MTTALLGLKAHVGLAGHAAGLGAGLRRWGRGAWQALESHGQRRAMRILRELALQRRAMDPELARQLLDLTEPRSGPPGR